MKVLFAVLALLAAAVPASAQTAPACSVTVSTPSALQAAIDSHRLASDDGRTICVAQGVYDITSTLQLPNRIGAVGVVTITTAGGCADRPMTGADKPALALLRTMSASLRVLEAPQARGWRLQCLAFGAAPGVQASAFLWLGDPFESDVTKRAVGIDLDRIVCDPGGQPLVRCVYIGLAENVAIRRSWFGDVLMPGTDSQAIAAGNAYCGPCIVEDNTFGTATEIVIFGGSDPAVTNLNPTDIRILRNRFRWNPALKGSGKGVFKHHVELKQGIGALIAGNVFENTWSGEGHGYAPAVIISPRNQSGGCPKCGVSQVTIENNRFRNVASAIGLHGADDINISAQTVGLTVKHNLVEVTEGYALMVTLSPFHVLIERNTFLFPAQSGAKYGFNAMLVVEPGGRTVKMDSFTYRDNITTAGYYGIKGPSPMLGTPALVASADTYVFTGNVIAGLAETQAPQTAAYFPTGQTFATLADLRAGMGEDGCVRAYVGKGADCAKLPGVPVVLPPPPADPCVVTPLTVTVTRWPRGNGQGSKSGTWNAGAFTLVSAGFSSAPPRFDATDTRGCSVKILK